MKYVVLAIVVAFGLVLVARTKAEPQDAIRLDARITQVEQRLYTIETSVRNIEQQTRLAGMSQRGGSASQDDVAQLRAEIQALQVRVMEDECGLAKLDERTLTAVAREARRKSVGNDPCRTNFELPLRPPSR